MQNASVPNWHARELEQLQDEIALLRCLLGAITPIGKPHEDTHRHPVVPPTAERPTPKARRNPGSSRPSVLTKVE